MCSRGHMAPSRMAGRAGPDLLGLMVTPTGDMGSCRYLRAGAGATRSPAAPTHPTCRYTGPPQTRLRPVPPPTFVCLCPSGPPACTTRHKMTRLLHVRRRAGRTDLAGARRQKAPRTWLAHSMRDVAAYETRDVNAIALFTYTQPFVPTAPTPLPPSLPLRQAHAWVHLTGADRRTTFDARIDITGFCALY